MQKKSKPKKEDEWIGQAGRFYRVTKKAKYTIAVLMNERKRNPEYEQRLQSNPDAKEKEVAES